ncbi:NAD-dependent epimerase/dehydratase family protein [Aerococcus viridans]|uniref:NAD-dependent epimerase/dehydratase family protein n=1 Tax=Aerococcus viridans TaxID=1377 RepID=UPI003B22790C
MKRILITGKNSYIGNAFEGWVSQWPNEYQISKISVRDDKWKSEDWSRYDVILHVAGIAHNSSDASLEELYYSVNRDLSYKIAKKARNEGVKQFIYLSSIIVYGTKNERITKDTSPNPDNFYGDSKLQAEQLISKLSSDEYHIAIIRPPMVYGKNSKGNFPLLVKMARILPTFPKYENKRSMIYIKNLTEFIRIIIDRNEIGYFHPQNPEYISTDNLVKTISLNSRHKIILIKGFSKIINKINKNGLFNKIFGNLYYDKEISDFLEISYQMYDLKDSIAEISENDVNNKS